METSTGPCAVAVRAMLPNKRSWKRYLLCATAVLILVTLYAMQDSNLTINPRAFYIPRHWPWDKAPQKEVTANTSQEDTGYFMTPHESFMREREKVYKERLQRVQEVCQQLGTTVYYNDTSLPLNHLLWVNSRRLAMCFNAKVGSSTWMQYLLQVEHPDELRKKQNFNLAAIRVLRPPKKTRIAGILKDFKKIMIVRHPFVRLVSAYSNKLQKAKTGKNKRVADAIVARYRSLPSKGPPTFEEFVRYVIDSLPPTDDVNVPRIFEGLPIHWSPFYVRCAPCNFDYDVILDLETINEDTRYVNESCNLGLKTAMWENRTSLNSTIVTLDLFKALPRNLTEAVYQRYRVDFLMFGYSLAPFLAET